MTRSMVRRTARRVLAGTGVGIAALALGACGFDVQTNQAYVPAEGVNADIGQYETEPAVKVRNIVIVATGDSTGYLSASMSAAQPQEALTSVSATALKADGTDANALSVSLPGPVSIGTGLTVLTDQAPITVSGAMTPGYTARIVLNFSKAGQATVVTPIVTSTEAPWSGVTPASPSASPSATPSS